MTYPKILIVVFLMGSVVLSGCSGEAKPAATQVETPTAIPTKIVPVNGEHYSSVLSLKDAFVGAGGVCSTYTPSNQVTRAAESGTCGNATVLSVYSSTSDRDAVVDGMKQFADMVGMNLLVGENWIVNDKNVVQYQPKLAGTLVTRSATNK